MSELDRLDHEAATEGTDQARVASVAPAVRLTGLSRGGRLPSPGNVAALQRLVGNHATSAVVGGGRAVLARLGTPLDQPLPAGAEVPAHDTKRETPDHTAFLPDAARKVDMTGYRDRERPDHTNFDYGFWDEASNSHWHANHYEAGPADPMIVYQSTPARFSHVFEESPGETRFGYPDFDREVFGVAKAENYDPSKATKPNLTLPRFMGPDGKPDPTIERVFRGKATLQAGSPAGGVKMLQQALLDLKKYDLGDFGPAKDGVDGKYGNKTSSAVKQFKVAENLGAQSQGSAGRRVILRLDELFPP